MGEEAPDQGPRGEGRGPDKFKARCLGTSGDPGGVEAEEDVVGHGQGVWRDN